MYNLFVKCYHPFSRWLRCYDGKFWPEEKNGILHNSNLHPLHPYRGLVLGLLLDQKRCNSSQNSPRYIQWIQTPEPCAIHPCVTWCFCVFCFVLFFLTNSNKVLVTLIYGKFEAILALYTLQSFVTDSHIKCGSVYRIHESLLWLW